MLPSKQCNKNLARAMLFQGHTIFPMLNPAIKGVGRKISRKGGANGKKIKK